MFNYAAPFCRSPRGIRVPEAGRPLLLARRWKVRCGTHTKRLPPSSLSFSLSPGQRDLRKFARHVAEFSDRNVAGAPSTPIAPMGRTALAAFPARSHTGHATTPILRLPAARCMTETCGRLRSRTFLLGGTSCAARVWNATSADMWVRPHGYTREYRFPLLCIPVCDYVRELAWSLSLSLSLSLS